MVGGECVWGGGWGGVFLPITTHSYLLHPSLTFSLPLPNNTTSQVLPAVTNDFLFHLVVVLLVVILEELVWLDWTGVSSGGEGMVGLLEGLFVSNPTPLYSPYRHSTINPSSIGT